MAEMGRPSLYKEEYNDQAYKLCLLGATDKELSDFFDVVEDTINEWKQRYENCSVSIERGKTIADSNVADKLYQRALGYSHPDVELKVLSDGQGQGSRIEKVDITKHYPPETAAAIFWLKNRQSSKWRDKQEFEHKGELRQIFKIGDQEIEL